MRAPLIKNLRRFLIGVIVLLLLAVMANFLYIRRHRSQTSTETHHILSPEMILSAESEEYAENRNGTVRFKIRAQKRLETRMGKNYLQGIEAFDINPDGSIRNSIHSQKAEYDREHGIADFFGDVRIRLSNGIELRTDSLHYDRNTNLGTTSDRLQLISGAASGTALGMSFDSEKEFLSFGDVDLVMVQKRMNPDGKAENVKIHASSEKAFLSESARIFRFRDKAHIDAGAEVFSGDEIEAVLSADQKHFHSIKSSGHSVYHRKESQETSLLNGDRIEIEMDEATGAIQNLHVSGQAAYSSVSENEGRDLRASEIYLKLDPAKGLPVQFESKTGVRFQIKSGNGRKVVSANKLQATFVHGSKNLESIHATQNASIHEIGKGMAENELKAEDIQLFFVKTGSRVRLEKVRADGSAHWTSTPSKQNSSSSPEATRQLIASSLEIKYSSDGDSPESGSASGAVALNSIPAGYSTTPLIRQLLANYVRFQFYPRESRLKDMYAEGRVRVKYEKTPVQSGSLKEKFQTESDKMQAVFQPSGKEGAMESATQWGNFSYKDDSKTATSGKCDYEAAKERMILRESPKIIDSQMGETRGDEIEYDQKHKILFVHRGVRTVFSQHKGSSSFLGSSGSSFPIVVTAEEMKYSSELAETRYTGNVDLLSEEQRLQSQELEIINGGEKVSAQGGTMHYIYRTGAGQGGALKKARSSADTPMNIQCAGLQYTKETNTITYSGNVLLHSANYDISSVMLSVKWEKEGKRIERSTAHGKVVIHQGARICRGEKAEYYLDPERFEVTGSPAEIDDPGTMKSTAQRLISFITESKTDSKTRLESR
jgi:lipopolysaccharide export system protein LptA